MDFTEIINSALENPTAKLLLLWSGLGLIIGVVAKIIIPGNEDIGWIRTILMGLAGSFLGNFVTPKLFNWPTYAPFSMQGIAIGIAGAILLVAANRVVTKS